MQIRQAEQHMPTSLRGIAQKARKDPKHKFGNLYGLLNEGNLRWCFSNLNRKASPGVDEVDYEMFSENLSEKIEELTADLKGKRYHAKLVKRRYIPKGSGRRPLGIPVIADKVVQTGAAEILLAIYEEDFLPYSHGYRRGRGPSGRVHLESVHDQVKACVEFSVRGYPQDLAALRSEFLELSQSLDMDIAFQTDNMFRRNRRLVCFDMDSTLIETEVIDELAKKAGVGDQVAVVTEAAMQGKIDFVESFKQRVALLKGLQETVLGEIAKSLPLTEGAESLITNLKRAGYKTAILSGGFTYFGEYLKRKLGIDYVFANTSDIDNGEVTGNVVEPVIDGHKKADLLRLMAQQENISLEQVIAVGDGANDLPMLSAAGLGIAFKAKPIVEASAKQSIFNSA